MELFLLYQTDRHTSKSSRVLFGVFSSEENALNAANINGLSEYESEIVIEKTLLDKFIEI